MFVEIAFKRLVEKMIEQIRGSFSETEVQTLRDGCNTILFLAFKGYQCGTLQFDMKTSAASMEQLGKSLKQPIHIENKTNLLAHLDEVKERLFIPKKGDERGEDAIDVGWTTIWFMSYMLCYAKRADILSIKENLDQYLKKQLDFLGLFLTKLDEMVRIDPPVRRKRKK